MSKLNRLITNWKPGLIYTSSHLLAQGYSPSLLAQYRRSGWLNLIGKGAFAKSGDTLDWRGGLEALQKQLSLEIHVAAKTALKAKGVFHYLAEKDIVFLFGTPKTRLPTWFKLAKWNSNIKYITTALFHTDLGITYQKLDNFSLKISTRERALFEQLYLVPGYSSFQDSVSLFEGQLNLRHDLIQNLLSECQSIKVKRMFMAIAEELKYPWLNHLDTSAIDFGHGNRLIEKGGKTHSKYKIVVRESF